jgi:hypothetical protein
MSWVKGESASPTRALSRSLSAKAALLAERRSAAWLAARKAKNQAAKDRAAKNQAEGSHWRSSSYLWPLFGSGD